jgi:hypothetical protein
MGAGNLTGGPCGGARGNAVVDDDGAPTVEVEPWTVAPVLPSAPFQLDALVPLDGVDVEAVEAGGAQDILVLYANSLLTDGSHRKLGLEGDPQLPDHDDVERRTKDLRDLEGDGHSATWQSEHDDIAISDIGTLHHLGQVTTSIHSIAKPHAHLLGITCSVSRTHFQG